MPVADPHRLILFRSEEVVRLAVVVDEQRHVARHLSVGAETFDIAVRPDDVIGDVADRAEKLKSHVDVAYRKLLDKEVKGYRELIAIWRKRLKDGI